MNPGYMPPHFERGVVERVRGDGRCEIQLTNPFPRVAGGSKQTDHDYDGPYVAQVMY
jgi:hypothetical protein